uniref:Uncharacterized protein n=1 Tax=Megaselia scalaris TaxID=36166 RepID=T1GNR8_MEGSC
MELSDPDQRLCMYKCTSSAFYVIQIHSPHKGESGAKRPIMNLRTQKYLNITLLFDLLEILTLKIGVATLKKY